VLVAVTCFLIEPLEFTVAMQSANLGFVQVNAVQLEGLLQVGIAWCKGRPTRRNRF
jgi:hypothetical protein